MFHPVRGPESGVHTYDLKGLDDMSPASISREFKSIEEYSRKLSDIDPTLLGDDLHTDYTVLKRHIAFRMDELTDTKSYTYNPYLYSDIIQVGLLFQMLFDYPGTTRDSRLLVVFAQLDGVSPLVDAAIGHLKSVPLEYLDYGIESLKDTKGFIRKDLRQYFKDARLPNGRPSTIAMRAKVRTATAAIDRLIAHLEKLKRSPIEKPSFALGEKGLVKRLSLKEGITLPQDTPFKKILEETEAEIQKEKTAFSSAAHAIDPSKSPIEVWSEVQKNHPRPGEVVATVRPQVDKIVEFLKMRDIIAIPSTETVSVKKSPLFMLYWYATMWQTGPFEGTPAPQAVYYVSDPKGLIKGAKAQSEFLTAMVTPELYSTSAHEAYPGHFLQGYALKTLKRDLVDKGVLSKIAVSNIFAPYHFFEGWAHYCEQMMREEGFMSDASDREYQEYLLGQYSDSLLRLCRTYAGIRMQTGEWNISEATEFFSDNAYITEDYAETEAQRGAYEPDYILYSIGKMMILDLRTDYKDQVESHGGTFSLKSFHDTFLAIGQYPIPVIKRKMIQDISTP